jgi:hypothetical protein
MKLFARDGEEKEGAMLATKNKQTRLTVKCSSPCIACVSERHESSSLSFSPHVEAHDRMDRLAGDGNVLSAPLLMHFIIIDTIFPRLLCQKENKRKVNAKALETRSQLLPRTHDTSARAFHGFLSRRLVEIFSA